jgi:hypothetical protein
MFFILSLISLYAIAAAAAADQSPRAAYNLSELSSAAEYAARVARERAEAVERHAVETCFVPLRHALARKLVAEAAVTYLHLLDCNNTAFLQRIAAQLAGAWKVSYKLLDVKTRRSGDGWEVKYENVRYTYCNVLSHEYDPRGGINKHDISLVLFRGEHDPWQQRLLWAEDSTAPWYEEALFGRACQTQLPVLVFDTRPPPVFHFHLPQGAAGIPGQAADATVSNGGKQ